jgi:hypothetical protein
MSLFSIALSKIGTLSIPYFHGLMLCCGRSSERRQKECHLWERILNHHQVSILLFWESSHTELREKNFRFRGASVVFHVEGDVPTQLVSRIPFGVHGFKAILVPLASVPVLPRAAGLRPDDCVSSFE